MTDMLNQELHRMVSALQTHYHPIKIILFGSSVTGRTDQNSDLDLVVIKETNTRFYDRIGEVLRIIRPREAVDILVYTPEEYARLTRESWFVGEEIAKKGKVLYAVS
ncbi:nucleotidyltransferase domain-containing protein [Candidatus Gottesmanbacteria bacterium]|nr:nucleotidyltransferase domain-containing protein [Candidatus Gottesmanbacteria bacterium]